MESPRPGSTRRQILQTLRRSPATVADLARGLKVTENAVRVHVLALERDGLIRPRGRRASARKPAVVYGLAPAAERLFDKPYAAVLSALLDELKEQSGADAVRDLAVAVGHRFARAHASAVESTAGHARLEAITQLINELGGLAELDGADGQLILTGYSCPLVAVVPAHPEVCLLTQTFIGDLLGEGSVRETCQRGAEIRCRFEIDLPSTATEKTLASERSET